MAERGLTAHDVPRSAGDCPTENPRTQVPSQEVDQVKQMLLLLFIAVLVFFVSSYDDVIAPYWEHRVTKAFALVEKGKYREAIETLISEGTDVPERSSSSAHAAQPEGDAANSGGPELAAQLAAP